MKIIYFFVAGLILSACSSETATEESEVGIQIDETYNTEEFMAADLQEWDFYGIGQTGLAYNQLIFSETEGTKGVMLVSPKSYGNNILVSYDVMTLTPATVLVALMSMHNAESLDLEFESDYDANIAYLFENVNFYMIAFHDAPHNRYPFVNKFPDEGNNPLQEAEKTYMHPGIYYHIEVGREGDRITLSIDGKMVLDTIDSESFEGGKFVFRIRGTGHHLASCMIKNLRISSKI